MERERRNGNYNQFASEIHIVGTRDASPLMPSNLLPILSSPVLSASGGNGGHSFIEHQVSKMDTLAGVAIKYGVEVADIKKMNGLVTDLQMFALKSLQIPLPGRHPPSPCLSNGSDTPGRSNNHGLLDSFQSLGSQRKVSPAMSSLQGYYGLKPPIDEKTLAEGFEMAVYRKAEDGGFSRQSLSPTNPPLSLHRKSRSVANGLNGDESESDKLVRRMQKYEADFSCTRTPEMMLKEDNSNSGGGFSAITGKGLALRPKAAGRTSSDAAAAEAGGGFNPIPMRMADESFGGVRKSSSTSSLQDQDNNGLSIWSASKWNLKADPHARSAGAITRPIFDALPKPITGRRNKAALD